MITVLISPVLDPVCWLPFFLPPPRCLSSHVVTTGFCICLQTEAGLHRNIYLHDLPVAFTSTINYNNDIHVTAHDVTKGLIGPC